MVTGLQAPALDEALALARNSDSRLVLLVATDPRALRAAAGAAATELGWRSVDLNTELTRVLIPLTTQERQEAAWDLLLEVVGPHRDGVVLASTDILFEPMLGYRPYEALRRLGRQGSILAPWFGTVDGQDIVRAHPGHPEYVRARLDVPWVAVASGGAPST